MQRTPFTKNLNEALQREIVVGEMFCGNSHTVAPEDWIRKFKAKEYRIVSFVLQASLETCFKRMREDTIRPKDYREMTIEKYSEIYDWFQNALSADVFAKRANVTEIRIDAESGKVAEVAESILTCLRTKYPNELLFQKS